jgi:hypothetical protein
MKQKNLLLAGIAILLIAVGIYFGSTMGSNKSNGNTNGNATETAGSSSKDNDSTSAGAKTSRTDRDNDASMAQLTEKYGDGRTKLSKKITLDMASLMKDAMELADMGAALGGATSAKELQIKQTTDALASRLNLTEEQKVEVAAIVAKRVEQRMAAALELAASLEKDPTSMMETILAGDAYKRGDIAEEEYKAISELTLDSMKQVSGFAISGRGGNDLSDSILAEQLGPILEPAQQEQLDGIVQKAADAPPSPQQLPLQNGNLPAMEIEKLDQTMESAKKFTTGIKAMIEGVQGMREQTPPGP